MTLLKPYQIERRTPEPSRAEKKRILAELCEEQDYRCYLCGGLVSWVGGELNSAVIEHVVPGKMGGCKDWSRSNLKAACVRCNNLKGSKRLNGKTQV